MNRRTRRLLPFLLSLLILMLLTACGQKAAKTDNGVEAGLKQDIETLVTRIVSINENELEAQQMMLEESGSAVLADAVRTWRETREITGPVPEGGVKAETFTETDEEYIVTVKVNGEKRTGTATVGVKKDLSDIDAFQFEYDQTLGEKFKFAFLNLVVGMGTVFLVLLFIAFVISSFKLINNYQKKSEKAKPAAAPAPVKAAPAPAAAPAEEDDLELIAVITAAIAAAEGTSADGLIVRSIRRIGTVSRRRA